jgi:hypothetical protein
LAWGLFCAAWNASVNSDKSFYGELIAIALPIAGVLLFLPRMFRRHVLDAERAARRGGELQTWYRGLLDRSIRGLRGLIGIVALAAAALAGIQWELHTTGTERRYAVGLIGLVAFAVAFILWAARELRQLRRERASI